MRPPAKISVLFPEVSTRRSSALRRQVSVDPTLKQTSPLPHHLQFRHISLTAIAERPEESPTARSFGKERRTAMIGLGLEHRVAVHPRDAAWEAAGPSERPQGWERQLRRIESSRKREKPRASVPAAEGVASPRRQRVGAHDVPGEGAQGHGRKLPSVVSVGPPSGQRDPSVEELCPPPPPGLRPGSGDRT